MLKHRGEILDAVVRKWCDENAWTIVALSKKLGQHPSTTYRQFEKGDLPFHIIKKFGKAMNHDFRAEFPEMADEDVQTVQVASDQNKPVYQTLTISQAVEQRDSWKEKYYNLLEKYNALLVKSLGVDVIKE